MTLEKKAKPKKKTYVLVATIAAYLIIAVLAYSFITGFGELNQKNNELAAKQEELRIIEEINKELETITKAGDDNAFIERAARDELGYAKNDERVFVDLTKD
jgi:cell division protein FtsB